MEQAGVSWKAESDMIYTVCRAVLPVMFLLWAGQSSIMMEQAGVLWKVELKNICGGFGVVPLLMFLWRGIAEQSFIMVHKITLAILMLVRQHGGDYTLLLDISVTF